MTEGFDRDVAADLVKTWQSVVPTGSPQIYERKTFDTLLQYIQLIGAAPIWAPLGVAGTAYLGRLAYLAADDTMGILRTKLNTKTSGRIEELAAGIIAARKKLDSPSQVLIGINVPDDRWGTVLVLDTEDQETLEREISIYASNVERISHFLKYYCERGEGPLGQGKITICQDGQIEIQWMSQRDFKKHHVLLPARP